jgi:hypothetical protein
VAVVINNTKETSLRLTEPDRPPTPRQVESWLGGKAYGFWTRVSTMIARNYPDVFSPEWLFGGKKHGWSLRYKKSKSFCTLIPEKNRFSLLIVFGADERAQVETIRNELSARTRKTYDEAATYHDGKWLLLNVDNEGIVADVERLLAVKRRPKTLKTLRSGA